LGGENSGPHSSGKLDGVWGKKRKKEKGKRQSQIGALKPARDATGVRGKKKELAKGKI